MTSEEYIEQIDRLMGLQNNYFAVFLGVIGLAIAVSGFLQWQINDKQIEKMKQEMRKEYNKELETAIKDNEEQFSFLTTEIVFSSIESIRYTSLDGIYLSERVFEQIKLLKDSKEINHHQTNILIAVIFNTIQAIKKPLKFPDSLEDIVEENKDTKEINTEEDKLKNKQAVLNLEHIIDFIRNKSDPYYLIEINFKSTVEEIFNELEKI